MKYLNRGVGRSKLEILLLNLYKDRKREVISSKIYTHTILINEIFLFDVKFEEET